MKIHVKSPPRFLPNEADRFKNRIPKRDTSRGSNHTAQVKRKPLRGMLYVKQWKSVASGKVFTGPGVAKKKKKKKKDQWGRSSNALGGVFKPVDIFRRTGASCGWNDQRIRIAKRPRQGDAR